MNFIFKLLAGLCLVTLKPVTPLNLPDYPLVVLHGIDSTSEQLKPFCDWLGTTFNKKVFNLEIGNGEKTSLYTPLTEQLNELCDIIYDTDELRNGFDFIGMSQGGILARGYVEHCNKYPVHNLITMVSPHGGIFFESSHITDLMYSSFMQKHFSVAGYWRNPLLLDMYFQDCTYLPLINNEISHPYINIYKKNICGLANFVMIWSPEDTVLEPPETGKFSMYDNKFNVLSLEETDIYIDDLLGLRFLNENKKLYMHETNCSHVDHRNPECYAQLYTILKQYLYN